MESNHHLAASGAAALPFRQPRYSNSRPGETRTPIAGFGDRYSAIELPAQSGGGWIRTSAHPFMRRMLSPAELHPLRKHSLTREQNCAGCMFSVFPAGNAFSGESPCLCISFPLYCSAKPETVSRWRRSDSNRRHRGANAAPSQLGYAPK